MGRNWQSMTADGQYQKQRYFEKDRSTFHHFLFSFNSSGFNS
jgi:hypothetical protein